MKPLFFAFALALLPIRCLAADAVTQHILTLNGNVIHYTARAGTITIYDEKRRPIESCRSSRRKDTSASSTARSPRDNRG